MNDATLRPYPGGRYAAGDGVRHWLAVRMECGGLRIFERATMSAPPVALGTAVDLETAQRFVNGLALLT